MEWDGSRIQCKIDSCPICDPEEAERLLKQRKSQNEKKKDVVTRVRKSVSDYSGEERQQWMDLIS